MEADDIRDCLSDAVQQARMDMENALSDWRDLESLIESLECEL